MPVTQGDSRVHGNGWTVNAESRLGVRGVEDLGGGLRAGFWWEASGSTADTTSSGSALPGTDRSRIFYLTPSPFGANPGSLGLGRLDIRGVQCGVRAFALLGGRPGLVAFVLSAPGEHEVRELGKSCA